MGRCVYSIGVRFSDISSDMFIVVIRVNENLWNSFLMKLFRNRIEMNIMVSVMFIDSSVVFILLVLCKVVCSGDVLSL